MRRYDVRQSKNLKPLQLSSKRLLSPSTQNNKFKFFRQNFQSVSPKTVKSQKIFTENFPLLKSSQSNLSKVKKMLSSPRFLKEPNNASTMPVQEKPQISNPKDSFEEKYSPKTHEFFHKVIGKIQIPRNSFRLTTATIESQDSELNFNRISPLVLNNHAVYSAQNSPKHTFELNTSKLLHLTKFEIIRKVFAAVAHFRNLNLHQLSTKRLYESFPGVPYGIKNSQNFIKAVKDGEFPKVAKMLQDNKWLAHIFDYTGQTPLHWAVIRNQFDIAKLLLDFKAFVDVNDYVRLK